MTKLLLFFMVYALGLLDESNAVVQGEASLFHKVKPRLKNH